MEGYIIFFFNDPSIIKEVREYIYIVLSLLTIVWSIQEKPKSWLLNIGKKVLGIPIYKRYCLLSKCTLDILLIFNSLYGLLTWKKKKAPKKITHAAKSLFLLACLSALLLSGVLVAFSYWAGGQNYILDGTHTACVVVTYLLLAHKKVEAWIFWLLANIVYVGVFMIKVAEGTKAFEWLLLGKYIAYTILAFQGWWKWRKVGCMSQWTKEE